MKLYKFLCLISLYLIREAYASDAFDFVYRFIDAKATSTNPGSSPDEFCARRAIQAVMGYWCSEGNHDPDTVVTWIGTLNMKTTLSGLQIRWAYSPKEVKIIVSSDDGATERTALDWRATASDEPSYDETLTFSKPVSAQIVKICMRGSKEAFYGITMVSPLYVSKPIVQIVSGITSATGEMCLQVANGDVFTDNTPVVLDYCSSAIAAGDGRELWRLNSRNQLQSIPSHPPKCLVLQGMNTTNGGDVVIEDCNQALQSNDGRSHWNFVSYGQIVLNAKNQSLCLSQRGDGAGFKNIINQKYVKVSASSASDTVHRPEKAIDGNPQTWWGSGSFPDFNEHRVVFDIDLGNHMSVSKIRVDWEYPPLTYMILVSKDSADWIDVGGSQANPSNVTQDTLPQRKIQYVRLSLERPHPRYGVFNKKYLYGIREIQVLASRLETIVEDRYKAGNSKDARDKYFLVAVREFNSVISSKLTAAETDFKSRLHAVQAVITEAEDLIPLLETCASSLKSNEDKIAESMKTSFTTQEKLQTLAASSREDTRKLLHAGLSIGDTKLLTAEDCLAIKKRNPTGPSGFYWLAPRCSTAPFRAWCSMTSGQMFHIWTGTSPKKTNTLISSLVNTPDSIRLRCAEMGLEPLTLHSKQDVETLILILTRIGFDWTSEHVFPLAFDSQCFTGQCSGIFRDLETGSDVTSLLVNLATPSEIEKMTQNYNTAGLRGRSISFFNIEEANIGAIFCSTNTLLSDEMAQPVIVECSTTAVNNPIFQKLTDTNVLIRCPPGCQEDTTLPVFGSNYVYHESSSLCRAALHAGVISNGGDFNVAIEGGRNEFKGSFENGIQSKSLTNDYGDRSIRIGPISKNCPIDVLDIEVAASSNPLSFIQLQNTNNYPSTPVTLQKNGVHYSFLQTDVVESGVSTEINELLEEIYNTIDELYGIDPHILVLLNQQTANTLGRTRGLLKPAEQLVSQQELKVLQVLQQTQTGAEYIYDALGDSSSSLQFELKRLEELLQLKSHSHEYNSWMFCPNNAPLSDVWESYLGWDITGSSDWRYNKLPLPPKPHSNEAVCNIGIVQSGIVTRRTSAIGTGSFLLAKDRRFFDFNYSVKFHVPYSQTATQLVVGVVFRAKNKENLYLFELDGSMFPGVKRLIRLYRGIPTILAESKDGAFVPGVWYRIYIQTLQNRGRICFGEETKQPNTIFEYQDEYHLSGTVGLFTSNTSPTTPVEFAYINVTTKSCKQPLSSELLPPAPIGCNILRDSYFTRFESFYTVRDTVESKGGQSQWSYTHNVDGRDRVLIQRGAIGSSDSNHSPGTLAIIKKSHTCPHGQFTFEYRLPSRCKSIGAVFRYYNENDYSVVEITPESNIQLRLKLDSKFLTIQPTKEEVSVYQNKSKSQWMKLILTFNGPFVHVHLKPSTTLNSESDSPGEKRSTYHLDFSAIPVLTKSNLSHPLRLGITTSMCPGAMFDKIHAGPVDFCNTHQLTPLNLLDHTMKNEKFGETCKTSQSYLERQSLCLELYIPNGEAVGNCIHEFCSNCCAYYTKILSPHYQHDCIKQCSMNDVFSEESKKAWISALSDCLEDSDASAYSDFHANGSHSNISRLQETCANCCSSHLQLNRLQSRRLKPDMSNYPSQSVATYHDTDGTTGNESVEMTHCKNACETKFARNPSQMNRVV